MTLRWLVVKSTHRRQETPEIRGWKADTPGGPVTTPFRIPAQFAIYSKEEWHLQIYDSNTQAWVDVPVESLDEKKNS